MAILKRIKRFWKLTKKDPKALEVLENLTNEQLRAIPDEQEVKAEFFGPGTEEEYDNMVRTDNGTKPWYDLLKRL